MKSARPWLRAFARGVWHYLDGSVHHPSLVLRSVSQLELHETDTYGWYVSIGRVRRVDGDLQLWLDDSARAGSRRVSAAFKAASDDVIKQLAQAGAGSLGTAITKNNDVFVREDGVFRMKKPLPKAEYGRVFAEFCTPWRFYSRYFPDNVEAESGNSTLLGQKGRRVLEIGRRRRRRRGRQGNAGRVRQRA